jgi:hypothetical protein
MSSAPKTFADFSACSSPKGSDILGGMGSNNQANNYRFPILTLFGNTAANHVAANGYYFVAISNATPANSSDTGGRPLHAMWCDDNYFYYITSANTVKRSVLSSF